MLATVFYPSATPATRPPLVIVHGLFGSARNWGVIARRLADERDVTAVDLRNHGDSPHHANHRYADLAADLAEVAQTLGQPADVLGHSMGGKAVMMLALTRPDLVRRIVVADIAPVAYDHDQNRNVHAMQALDLAGLTSRVEADRRLSAIIDDPALRAFFLQSLDLRANPPAWKLNLDVLEAEMPHIVGWPDPPGRFERPALFLSGTESHYVLPEHHDRITAQFPKARFARIPGASHWLHAEKPREFEETVRIFLNA